LQAAIPAAIAKPRRSVEKQARFMARKAEKTRRKTRPKSKAKPKRPVNKSMRAAAPPRDHKLAAALQRHVRIRSAAYLNDSNITSVGVGHKNGDGPMCLRFTVVRKGDAALEKLDTRKIPEFVVIDGRKVPTDVIERVYRPSFEIIPPGTPGVRQSRLDPIQPGISVSHFRITAGTIGLIVFDATTGRPCVLSCWHAINGPGGQPGDSIVQPGIHDISNPAGNVCAGLLRGHVGVVGDCALGQLLDPATNTGARVFDRKILGLGVTPTQLAVAHMNDHVIKSSRTTGVTHGIVCGENVTAKLDYGGNIGMVQVNGFEIRADADRLPKSGAISMGGDSGAAWLLSQNGAATDVFVGLHFSGNATASSEPTALACYAGSIQTKLNFVL
jgi:endonuclease G, mitochondrial